MGMRDDVKQELAAGAKAPLSTTGVMRPGKKRLWKVDLGKLGPVTPSAFFAREKPGDPRGQPIEAETSQEAVRIFYELHGILSYPHQPEVTELPRPEEDDADEAPPVKKTGGVIHKAAASV